MTLELNNRIHRLLFPDGKNINMFVEKDMWTLILKGTPFEEKPWRILFDIKTYHDVEIDPIQLAKWAHQLDIPEKNIIELRDTNYQFEILKPGIHQFIFQVEIDKLRKNLKSLQYYIDESPYFMADNPDVVQLYFYIRQVYPDMDIVEMQRQLLKLADQQSEIDFVQMSNMPWTEDVHNDIKNIILSTQRDFTVPELFSFIEYGYVNWIDIWERIQQYDIDTLIDIATIHLENFSKQFQEKPFNSTSFVECILHQKHIKPEKLNNSIPPELQHFWNIQWKNISKIALDTNNDTMAVTLPVMHPQHISAMGVNFVQALNEINPTLHQSATQIKLIKALILDSITHPNIWEYIDQFNQHTIELINMYTPEYVDHIFAKNNSNVPNVDAWSNATSEILINYYAHFWSIEHAQQHVKTTLLFNNICTKFKIPAKADKKQYDNPLFHEICKYKKLNPIEMKSTLIQLDNAGLLNKNILCQMLKNPESPEDIIELDGIGLEPGQFSAV